MRVDRVKTEAFIVVGMHAVLFNRCLRLVILNELKLRKVNKAVASPESLAKSVDYRTGKFLKELSEQSVFF